jgi:hypothetical protein
MDLRRVRVVGRGFAASAPPLSNICTVGACGKMHLGVGLRQPCQGQARGGMLEALARIAPARTATPRSKTNDRGSLFKVIKLENLLWGKPAPPPPRSQTEARNFVLAQQQFILNSSCDARYL